jgi:hypothetical protein
MLQQEGSLVGFAPTMPNDDPSVDFNPGVKRMCRPCATRRRNAKDKPGAETAPSQHPLRGHGARQTNHLDGRALGSASNGTRHRANCRPTIIARGRLHRLR